MCGQLPLVDAVDWLVRAGIIGAVFVWFGRWIAARWQRRTERQGLLRLLDLEIARHERPLIVYADDHKFRNVGGIRDVQFWRTDTWEQTRVRLAQLLTSNEFTRLAHYYRNAQDINDLLTADYGPLQRMRKGPGLRDSMVREGEVIRKWIRAKLPKDYQPPTIDFPE